MLITDSGFTMRKDEFGIPYTIAWNGQPDFGDGSAELGRYWIGKIVTNKFNPINTDVELDSAIRAIEVQPGIGVRHPSNPFPPNSNFWSDPKEYSRDNMKPYLWLLSLSNYSIIFKKFKEKHKERGGYKLQSTDIMSINTFNVMDKTAGLFGRLMFDLGTLGNVLVQLLPLPKYKEDESFWKKWSLKRNVPGSGLERDWLNIVVDMAARKYQGTETVLNKLAWWLSKEFGQLMTIFHEYYKVESGNNYEIAQLWFEYIDRN